MEQEDQTLLNLVKFTFFAAEIQPHLQAFLDGLLEGRSRWCRRRSPEGCNTHRGRVPAKPVGDANVRLTERVLKAVSYTHLTLPTIYSV